MRKFKEFLHLLVLISLLQIDNFSWDGSIQYESTNTANAKVKSATYAKMKEIMFQNTPLFLKVMEKHI